VRAGWAILVLAAAGCGSSTGPSYADGWPWHTLSVSGDVAFEGKAALVSDTVAVTLTARNRGTGAAHVEFGVCAFLVQGIGRHGGEWDNHPAPGVACFDFAIVMELAPGESRAIPVYRNAAALIRAKVPGDYYEVSIGFRATGGAALRRVGGGGLTL
jgi:hypothetical protein